LLYRLDDFTCIGSREPHHLILSLKEKDSNPISVVETLNTSLSACFKAFNIGREPRGLLQKRVCAQADSITNGFPFNSDSSDFCFPQNNKSLNRNRAELVVPVTRSRGMASIA